GVGIGAVGIRPVNSHSLAGSQPDVAVVGIHQIQVLCFVLDILEILGGGIDGLLGEHGVVVADTLGVVGGDDIVEQQGNVGKAFRFGNIHIAVVDVELGVLIADH